MIRLFIFMIAVILIVSCKSREAEPIENSQGILSCKLEGTQWTYLVDNGFQRVIGGISTDKNGKNCSEKFAVIGSSLSTKKWGPAYDLGLNFIPLSSGKYPIAGNRAVDCPEEIVTGEFYSTFQGDLPGDTYYSIAHPDSYVLVESYDENTKIIRGTFEMVALVAHKGEGHFLPDTIRFTDGRFQIRLKE